MKYIKSAKCQAKEEGATVALRGGFYPVSEAIEVCLREWCSSGEPKNEESARCMGVWSG